MSNRLINIPLRVEMFGAVARSVGGEDDVVVAGVNGADVVEGCWLSGHFGDDRGIGRTQPGDLV